GQAQYQTSSLPVAGSPHTVTVNYTNQDGNFQSGSGTLAGGQTVNAADTTTTVTSTLNPTVFGQPVTFTATVGTVLPRVAAPTGSVACSLDGAPPSPAVDLTNGQPTWTTAGLAVTGSPHTIAAQFGGSTSFKPSLGLLPGGQTVNPAGTSTTVTSDQATPA